MDRRSNDNNTRPSQAMVERLLASGGDSRIAISPMSGRNRYGVSIRPQPDEAGFGSCTASSTGRRGFAAAQNALEHILGVSDFPFAEAIRRRLLERYGVPGAECILAPSGTDCATLATALAGAGRGQMIMSIVPPSSETGSSVASASAALRHDSAPPFAGAGSPGALLAGFSNCQATSQAVRHGDGALLTRDQYEEQLTSVVLAALASGKRVILHLLDSSKTGVAPLARDTAQRLQALAPEQVVVLVDACQLRCSSTQIKHDLAQGWLVMITGSKFAGGPAFSGALLAPSTFVNADCRDLAGLAEFSARDDWPASWDKRPRDLSANRNLGLLLRWEAALAEIDVYEAASDRARQACLDIFGDAVRERVAACSELMLLPGGQPGRSDTIFTIMTSGQWRDGAGALKLRAALAESGPTRCHVGQPVAIDSGAALRVCASMPMINDALLRCAAGAAPSRAMKPILAQLDALFCLWNDIARPALARAC